MAVLLECEENTVFVKDVASVQALDRGFYGNGVNGKKAVLELLPEESLYLMDVRSAECTRNGKKISFNQLARNFNEGKKFLARFYCYRDWRDRGLVARSMAEAQHNYGHSPVVKYPSQEYHAFRTNARALYFYDDLMSVIDDNEEGQKLYEEHWFGQYGTYKAKKHGQFLKLDAYETLFLMKHAGLQANCKEDRIVKEATARRSDFEALYEVYEDWRMRGFVLKTGFKFGTHFRLYFPGAKPTLVNEEWMHSKHVIHVFPRESKMLISEWARAIRVAHGVRKTFILAIPGKGERQDVQLDFLLYHRSNNNIDNPKNSKPKFAMFALSEEEEIGGAELASAIEKSKKLGLDVILSICDRETSITHYRVKRIELPKSKYEYFEIEWIQP